MLDAEMCRYTCMREEVPWKQEVVLKSESLKILMYSIEYGHCIRVSWCEEKNCVSVLDENL